MGERVVGAGVGAFVEVGAKVGAEVGVFAMTVADSDATSSDENALSAKTTWSYRAVHPAPRPTMDGLRVLRPGLVRCLIRFPFMYTLAVAFAGVLSTTKQKWTH